MRSPLSLLAIFAIYFSCATAQDDSGVTTITSERTLTGFATTAISSVQTKHATRTVITITRTTTSTSTTTSLLRLTAVVPFTYTSILNVTSTVPATTSVYTSTITFTALNRINTTATSYFNVTATQISTFLTDSFVQRPTPSGFRPIYDSSGDTTFNSSLSKRQVESRKDELQPRQADEPSLDGLYVSLISIVTWLIPESTSTVFATSTRTKAQNPPATITARTTTTVNKTVSVPDSPVSSTVFSTISTTLNVTQVITSPAASTVATVTFTQTNYTSTKTNYAACATNNLLGPQIQHGSYISSLIGYGQTLVTNATSPAACCAACQDSAAPCYAAYFDTLATANPCMLDLGNTRNPDGSYYCPRALGGFFETNRTTSNRWIAMNGNCAYLIQRFTTTIVSSTTSSLTFITTSISTTGLPTTPTFTTLPRTSFSSSISTSSTSITLITTPPTTSTTSYSVPTTFATTATMMGTFNTTCANEPNVFSASNGKNFAKYCNQLYYGTTLLGRNGPQASYAACVEQCANNPPCSSFVYLTGQICDLWTGTATLKGSGTVYDSGGLFQPDSSSSTIIAATPSPSPTTTPSLTSATTPATTPSPTTTSAPVTSPSPTPATSSSLITTTRPANSAATTSPTTSVANTTNASRSTMNTSTT